VLDPMNLFFAKTKNSVYGIKTFGIIVLVG